MPAKGFSVRILLFDYMELEYILNRILLLYNLALLARGFKKATTVWLDGARISLKYLCKYIKIVLLPKSYIVDIQFGDKNFLAMEIS